MVSSDISVVALARSLGASNQDVLEAAGQMFTFHGTNASTLTAAMANGISRRLQVIQEAIRQSKPPHPRNPFSLPDGEAIILVQTLAWRPGAVLQTFRQDGRPDLWTLLSVLNTYLSHGSTGSEVLHWYLPHQLSAEMAWRVPLDAWRPLGVRTQTFQKALGSQLATGNPLHTSPSRGLKGRPTDPPQREAVQGASTKVQAKASLPSHRPALDPSAGTHNRKFSGMNPAQRKAAMAREKREYRPPEMPFENPGGSAETLSARPQRVRVHLRKGLEAAILCPAFFVDGHRGYFSGCTIPTTIRAISRPGHQLLQTLPEETQAVIVKKVFDRGGEFYFMTFGPATKSFVLGRQESEWKPCSQFKVLEYDYFG